MNKKQQKEYNALSDSEKRVYNSVMSSFPETNHTSALDIAIMGGVKFQFYPK